MVVETHFPILIERLSAIIGKRAIKFFVIIGPMILPPLHCIYPYLSIYLYFNHLKPCIKFSCSSFIIMPVRANSTSSDSGGVAARLGFKYQDHVAAAFLIEMMTGEILEVQCETSDDVVVIHSINGIKTTEFVQVKTTEGNKKWNLTELCKKNPVQSVFSNSLFQDSTSGEVTFRIVSKRDVDKKLSILKTPLLKRIDDTQYIALSTSLNRQSKKFKSPNGNDGVFWALNTLWQVSESVDALEATNLKKLFLMFQQSGCILNHDALKETYDKMLEMVDKAAIASKVNSPEKKVIKQEDIELWWLNELKELKIRNKSNYKPYQEKVDALLLAFHQFSEDDILRGFTGLDIGYEYEGWRYTELADHIKEWLPEICLKASELSSINHTNYHSHYKKAARKITQLRKLRGDELIADILLHIAIRQCFNSEPIACKVFYATSENTKCFPNAHIIRKPSSSTSQLWLGKAVILPLKNFSDCAGLIIETLEDHLDKDFLKDEREIILDLKESQHLLPNNIDQILNNNVSLDVLVKNLCIPILISYDSPSLKTWTEDYQRLLIEEVNSHYSKIKGELPTKLEKIEIHIFLIPLESCSKFIEIFDKAL